MGKAFAKQSASHLYMIFEDYNGLLDQIENRLTEKGWDFDTIVGSGLSGAMVVPAVASRMNKTFAIVRKRKGDHSPYMVEGTVGERWVFVDDLIASGSTLKRVVYEMADISSFNWHTGRYENYVGKCVGVYQYYHDKADSDVESAILSY